MTKMIPLPEQRIKKFEEMAFGMFIHWGLYSQLGKGEWIQRIEKIPKEEYVKLKDTFTAKDFNPREIARLAKNAGMKYIVLTTRHHEGFSLYDTKGLNDYDAVHSPARRDLVAEYVSACREEGIVPFFYHTTMDWYVESYNNNFKEYLKYLRDSIEILCTNYGEIGGFWFDGNWDKPNEDWEENALYSLIRKYQPEAMIINNTGIHNQGEYGHMELDSVTFEQGRPKPLNREGAPKYLAAEMCQTINAHWSIGKIDFNYKSLPYLIENLCACRKVGANYLLNIGPTPTGGVLKIQEGILEMIGDWINICSTPIYQGKPSIITAKGKNFALKVNDKKEYLFIHDLAIEGHQNVTVGEGGVGPKIFENINKKIKSISWVDNSENLSFIQDLDKKYLSVYATGYPYGVDLVVRLAEVNYRG